MANWETINTAPKDGTVIDVWVPGEFGSRWVDVCWSKSSHQCIDSYCDSCPNDLNVFGWRDPIADERLNPSHWMPRPAPPQSATGKL